MLAMFFRIMWNVLILEKVASTAHFEAEIEVIDSRNHSDKWYHTGQKSDIDLVNAQLIKMKRDVEERECRRNKDLEKANLICGPPSGSKRLRRSILKARGCNEGNKQRMSYEAVTVALGDITYLNCMICDANSELGSKIWFKFNSAKIASETLWFATEVELDKHDNHKLNRVFMTPDHILVIKDFQPGDAGAYFCAFHNQSKKIDMSLLAFRAETLDEASPIAMAQTWEKLSGYNVIGNMIYVDAELQVQSIIVSKVHGSGYPQPRTPRKNTEANWIMFYQWGEWSPCSDCGHAGERKRKGRCVVRKIDDKRPSSPPFLDYVLKLYPRGATCQSTIFKSRSQVAESPHEIEVAYCDKMCEGILAVLQNLLSHQHAGYTVMRIFGHVKSKLRTNLREALKEGDTVTIIRRELDTEHLPCPGYYHESLAAWYYNGSQIISALEISNITNRRITLLPDYTIRILQLSVFDSGRYSCYVNHRVTIDIFFAVLPRRNINVPKLWPGILNFLYFMAPSFVVLAVMKVFLDSQSYAKVYAYRTEQSRRTRGRIPKSLPNINTNSNYSNYPESILMNNIDDELAVSPLSGITIDSDYSSCGSDNQESD